MASNTSRPGSGNVATGQISRGTPPILSAPLATARRAQGEVAGMARLLDPDADLNAQLEVLTQEGLATSAIEGETFDPGSLRSSLARRLGLPTAGLPPALRSVEGLADVLLDATRRYDRALTLEKLCDWQAALFPTGRSGLHKVRVGRSAATIRCRLCLDRLAANACTTRRRPAIGSVAR